VAGEVQDPHGRLSAHVPGHGDRYHYTRFKFCLGTYLLKVDCEASYPNLITLNRSFQIESISFSLNEVWEEKEARPIFICWVLSKEASGTILITSLVWRSRWSNPQPPAHRAALYHWATPAVPRTPIILKSDQLHSYQ